MRTATSLGAAVVGMTLAVGVAGYWFGSKTGAAAGTQRASSEHVGSSSSGPIKTERNTNGALRSQVAQLELRVAALTALIAEQKQGSGTPGQLGPDASDAPAPTPEQVERDKAQWEDQMVAVDADFEAEPRDSRWASSATNLLRDRATDDEVMRTALKQIDCRSTICRVDMIDDQKGDFARQLPVFLQSLGSAFPTGQASTVENPDGTRTLSIYLSTTTGSDAPGSRGG